MTRRKRKEETVVLPRGRRSVRAPRRWLPVPVPPPPPSVPAVVAPVPAAVAPPVAAPRAVSPAESDRIAAGLVSLGTSYPLADFMAKNWGATNPSDEGFEVLVSPIYPPTPDPTEDGALWFDPSSGQLWAWYDGAWVAPGVPAPSAPTPLVGRGVTITVGSVALLIKRLNLPVPYFDGGNAYYSQFAKTAASGWDSPSFFPFATHLSHTYPPHADNLRAAGLTHYSATDNGAGDIERALAAGMGVHPYSEEWPLDAVDAEDGDPPNPLVNGWDAGDELELVRGLGLPELNRRLTYIHAYNDGRITTTNLGNGVLGVGETGGVYASEAEVIAMVRAVDVCACDQYFYSGSNVRYNATQLSPYWPGGPNPDDAKRSASYGWLGDRMRAMQDPEEPKPYGVWIETALPLLPRWPQDGLQPSLPHITLPQISGAAWSAIRHGTRMINFFQQNNNGRDPFYSISDEASVAIRGQVTALTTEITAFAPVLDGPTYEWDFGDDNIETMLKTLDDDAYIFAGPSITCPLAGGGSSDIERLLPLRQYQFDDTAETGTVSSTVNVPPYTELVVVAVSGLHGTNNGFAAMTFTKGGVDTAMVKATGGDASGASWQSAMFYLDMPDEGDCTLKWDWLGAASDGPRVVAVTFWRGIDLSEPVRDSGGAQDTGFPLNTPILIETPTIAMATGDKVLAFSGFRNPAEDGLGKVNVWHHAATLIGADLSAQGYAEGQLATGTPDGDCTVGIESISSASEAAVVAIAMKGATLEAVTSTVVQTGAVHTTGTQGNKANTGTFFTPATVPADCDFILAAVTGFTGLSHGFASISMPKGGVDTPMVRLTGGDSFTSTWQGAMFYMVAPDTGAGKDIKWNWAGSASVPVDTLISLTYWKGVHATTPIRDWAGVQADDAAFPEAGVNSGFPLQTPMLTNREGDVVAAFFGGFTPGATEGSVDSWKNLTLLDQLTHSESIDGAWATNTVIGSLRVGVNTVTTFTEGALMAAVIRPAAAVTPITPAADPPTTARTVTTGTFTLPPDLAAATTVTVLNEGRTIPITAGVFTDTFDEEWVYHNYRIAIP